MNQTNTFLGTEEPASFVAEGCVDGDHVGDCEAPCQCLCPLQMEIPRMIREIRAELVSCRRP